MSMFYFQPNALSAFVKASCLLLSFTLTTDVLAKTVYVSSSGSDSNSGQATSQPMKTVYEAAKKLSNGDQLLLKRGDVFDERATFLVDENNVLVGAYGSGSTKPVINGKKFSEPGGVWDPQLKIDGNNVTIKDIEFKQSSGFGIRIANDSKNVLIKNVFINGSYQTGIMAEVNTENLTIEDSEVYWHNWVWGNSDEQKRSFSNSGLSGGWGQGIHVRSKNFVIRNNHVHSGWGEGIGTQAGARYGLIEGNTLESNKAVGIYVDNASNIEIKNNQVDGGTDTFYWRSHGRKPGHGIGIQNELIGARRAKGAGIRPGSRNININNNTVTNTGTGIFIWSADASLDANDIDIKCNAFVDNLDQSQFLSDTVKNLDVRNNIFVADSGSGNKMISSFSLNGSFNFQDNFWSWTPERNQVIGSNDRIGGYHERVADVYSGCKGGAAESQSETMPPLSPLNVRVKVI